MAARRTGGGRAGSFLLVVGCLAVLGGTFALGVMAGRHWPGSPAAKSEAGARTLREKDRDRGARAPEPTPTLTFYQELTAPLTAPPPARPPKPRAEKNELAKPDAPNGEAGGAAPAAGQFTIQAGAYKAREPADALRARLAAQGHDAYVVESESPAGVRFRVRVGSFPTREAAQAAAARLGAGERAPSTFVTTR